MRVLFLAFEFPPLATAGVFRALQFATGLSGEGFALDIVTVRESDYVAWTGTPLDREIAQALPAGNSVRVHRIASGFPAWYWAVRRSPIGAPIANYAYWGEPVARFWRRPLFACLDRLVATAYPDVLLATVPPFGVGVLARAAARRYRLPLVVDWRDPWTLWRAGPFPSYGHYRVARARERAILRDANTSIVTSHVTRDDWVTTARAVDGARMSVIYNGYDAVALAEVRREVPPRAPLPDRPRRIVYVGNFYYDPSVRAALTRPVWRRPLRQWLWYTRVRQDWLYRSPYFFLRGLRRAVDRDGTLAARVRVELAGPVPAWLPAMLRETDTAALVTLVGPISHADALRRQHDADALLLTSARRLGGRGPASDRDFSVAGKLAEYFGLRRPILGVLTAGAMRDLVVQSGLGLLADPDDADAIADRIAAVAGADDPATLVTPDEAFLESFDCRRTAREIGNVLRRAAAEGVRT